MSVARDDRVKMVSSFSERNLELARGCPITMALTVAVNGLSMTWHRHAGGPWRPEDRAVLEVTALLCIRLLSAKGAPRMRGGIASKVPTSAISRHGDAGGAA